MSIRKAIEKILESGTKIVSFDYNGVRRNVLVGASAALVPPKWGEQLNRAIRTHKGRVYLTGIDNNDQRTFKSFRISKIENPSFVR